MQETQIKSQPELPVGPRLARWAPAWCALLLLAAAASAAHAQVWVDAGELNGKLPDWVDPAYVKPAPEQHERIIVYRHWCEPVYRTVCQRVWHEAVVHVVWERVWVPARYELRDCWCDGHHSQELVQVEPGHYETCRHEVVVSPGCWETIEVRELVSAGHYED
jgi:hypothetical protein